MFSARWPPFVRGATPVAAVAIATAASWLLVRFAPEAPALLLFSSVLLTSWQVGMRGGLVSAALAIISLNVLFIPPFGISLRPEEVLETILFGAFSVIMSKLVSDLHEARTRILAANEKLEVKVEERTAEIRKLMGELESEVELRGRIAEELKRSNRELEQFAHGISHDLREPLRTVVSFSQLLGMRYTKQLDADGQEMLSFIEKDAKRLETMIRDLLDYSQALNSRSAPAPVDLREVVEAAIQNLSSAISESGAVVSFGELPTVPGDGPQLVRLFQNLIGNALKYRKRDTTPRIDILARQQGNEWLFAIADNGIGFDPKFQERIFAVFQRLHKNEYSGTGVGLALCRGIAEQHSGRIWAEGRPGEGTTFFVTLPNAADSRAS